MVDGVGVILKAPSLAVQARKTQMAGAAQLELLRPPSLSPRLPRWPPQHGGFWTTVLLNVVAQGSRDTCPEKGSQAEALLPFMRAPASGYQCHLCPVGQDSYKDPPRLQGREQRPTSQWSVFITL